MDRAKNDLAQKTGDVVDQAKEQTGQAMEQARTSAFTMMDQQKSRAADGLGSVAQALRQTGDSLRSGDQGSLSQYADRAADTVDQFSQQLRSKSVEELLDDAEDFARREPEVFLGGAVLLGLLASRFFKASSRRSQMRYQNYDDYGYRSQYGRAYGQGNYGQSGMGSREQDRGSWGGEDIGYRSAGTGGYRTTVTGDAGTDMYGTTTGGSMTAGDVNLGRETSTNRRQQGSGSMGSERGDASWPAGEDESLDSGAGSSQA